MKTKEKAMELCELLWNRHGKSYHVVIDRDLYGIPENDYHVCTDDDLNGFFHDCTIVCSYEF